MWQFFEHKEISGKVGFRDKSKKCKKETAGLVMWIRVHFNGCILGAVPYSQEDGPPKLEKVVKVTTEPGKRGDFVLYINGNNRHGAIASLSNIIVKTFKHTKESFLCLSCPLYLCNKFITLVSGSYRNQKEGFKYKGQARKHQIIMKQEVNYLTKCMDLK